MAEPAEQMYEFACPECEESLEVNESMKATLIEKGCVICSSTVTAGAFDETASN